MKNKWDTDELMAEYGGKYVAPIIVNGLSVIGRLKKINAGMMYLEDFLSYVPSKGGLRLTRNENGISIVQVSSIEAIMPYTDADVNIMKELAKSPKVDTRGFG